MNQFYPNAVRSIAMDQAQGSGGLVTPPEPRAGYKAKLRTGVG